MLFGSPYSLGYLFGALEGGPDLFDHLLAGLTPEEADRRPDPDRFTIREVMAHLADWEEVFLGRMIRMHDEDNPTIEGMDEGQRMRDWLAVEHNYANSDPHTQLALFRKRRAETVAFLRALSPETWDRTALRPEIGPLTIEAQATLMPLHDAYHQRQVIAWRAAS